MTLDYYAVCDRCEPVVRAGDYTGVGASERTAVRDRVDTLGALVFTGEALAPGDALCDICGGMLLYGGAQAAGGQR